MVIIRHFLAVLCSVFWSGGVRALRRMFLPSVPHIGPLKKIKKIKKDFKYNAQLQKKLEPTKVTPYAGGDPTKQSPSGRGGLKQNRAHILRGRPHKPQWSPVGVVSPCRPGAPVETSLRPALWSAAPGSP